MHCNYNSFIKLINFHGFFGNALRCRKTLTGACRILVPLRYPFIHLGVEQQCGCSVLLKDKKCHGQWRESNLGHTDGSRVSTPMYHDNSTYNHQRNTFNMPLCSVLASTSSFSPMSKFIRVKPLVMTPILFSPSRLAHEITKLSTK